jgi:hypothetical protein
MREENGTSQGSSLLTTHWIHPKGSFTQDCNSTTIPPPFRSRTLERTQLSAKAKMKSYTKLLHGTTRKPVKMLTKSGEGYRVQG